MKKILLLFVISVTFVFASKAQTKEPQAFDEFGSISCDDLRFRLIKFMEEIQKSNNSKGYVIVYEGGYSDKAERKISGLKKSLPSFGSAALWSQYMIQQFKDKKFPSEKYLFVSGGVQEKYSVELWIVPKYSKPPIYKPTADKIKYRKRKLPKLESVCNGG